MKKLEILFLGAAKRTSLLERFVEAGSSLDVELGFNSCEKDDNFCPISHLAKIIPGPKFASPEFQKYLAETIDSNQIDIIIPTMDSATVALSKFTTNQPNAKYWPVVSDYQLCLKCEDKKLSEEFFEEQSLPTPPNTKGVFPKILKPKNGFGSKGVVVVKNQEEYDQVVSKNPTNYVVQDFIKGVETTVDFYVSPKKGLLGYVLRDRLEVSDGEVMICRTRPATPAEAEVIEKVAAFLGWVGCITLQYIKNEAGKVFVLEINPRFGGGATASIEAGLEMPKYLLAEYLGLDFNKPKQLKQLIMTRSRRDFFHAYK